MKFTEDNGPEVTKNVGANVAIAKKATPEDAIATPMTNSLQEVAIHFIMHSIVSHHFYFFHLSFYFCSS